jgi:hypothetical protein
MEPYGPYYVDSYPRLVMSSAGLIQFQRIKLETLCNIMLAFYGEGFVPSSFLTPKRRPSLVRYLRMCIQCTLSYAVYLKVVSGNLSCWTLGEIREW